MSGCLGGVAHLIERMLDGTILVVEDDPAVRELLQLLLDEVFGTAAICQVIDGLAPPE